MYMHIFLLRMTETVTSKNIDLFSWDTLYMADEKIVKDIRERKQILKKS
jgi:hypothetical protein